MAEEHHCWEVKASIDTLFLPSLPPPIQLGMGGGIRNAFLDCCGAEWAHFPSYSLELATASSVPDSFLRNQAKHWKLLLVHECWAKTAQATGICISPAFPASCMWMVNDKDAFTAVSAECALRSDAGFVFSPTSGPRVLADEEGCVVKGFLGCSWLA